MLITHVDIGHDTWIIVQLIIPLKFRASNLNPIECSKKNKKKLKSNWQWLTFVFCETLILQREFYSFNNILLIDIKVHILYNIFLDQLLLKNRLRHKIYMSNFMQLLKCSYTSQEANLCMEVYILVAHSLLSLLNKLHAWRFIL